MKSLLTRAVGYTDRQWKRLLLQERLPYSSVKDLGNRMSVPAREASE
jgi:hypothetical protein